MTHLRWGILGTGNIARQFAEGVAHAKRSRIVAVGSRSQRTADDFAEQFQISRAHGSYDALLADEGVDAIYLSLPNSLHHTWTLRALAAGKHVLCEKPFASNANQAQEMFSAAERAGLLLMEAFMYRCHPLTQQVVERVRQGVIGNLRLIRATFCMRTRNTAGTRFDAALAGGALMDVGCYCLSLARMLAQAEPIAAHAVGQLHPSGVDEYVTGSLQFPGGILGSFACALTVQTNNTAYICGDEGYIEIPVPWKPAATGARYVLAQMTPPRQDGALKPPPPRQTIDVDAPAPLFGLEADAFAAAVLDGAPLPVTKQDTLGNMQLLDDLRSQLGVTFPQ